MARFQEARVAILETQRWSGAFRVLRFAFCGQCVLRFAFPNSPAKRSPAGREIVVDDPMIPPSELKRFQRAQSADIADRRWRLCTAEKIEHMLLAVQA